MGHIDVGRVVIGGIVAAIILFIAGFIIHGAIHAVREDAHCIMHTHTQAGMVMAAVSLLEEIPNPTEHDVREGLEGNLCRCTGYHNIVKAIAAVAASTSAMGRAA